VLNPQKEPKLARARQIPEWEEYDTEIAQFTRQLAEEGKIHSRMATADTNVLAGAGTGSAVTSESDKPEGFTEVTVSENSETENAERAESENAANKLERDEL